MQPTVVSEDIEEFAPCTVSLLQDKDVLYDSLHVWNPVHEIHKWGICKDLGVIQIHEIIRLLDPTHLQSLPVRKKRKKWQKSPANINFRHHFYRQTTHILGWSEQHQFDPNFMYIVKRTWADKNGTKEKILKKG